MQNTPSIVNNNLTMSSREIADLCDKRHDNVMADIRTMLVDLNLDLLKFQGIYLDAYGRQQPCYGLDRELTMTLVTGYSTLLRNRIVKRWMELEAKPAPVTIEAPAPRGGEMRGMAVLMAAGVIKERAAVAALQCVERETGADLTDFYAALPNVASDRAGTLNATDIAESMGWCGLNNKPNARVANVKLAEAGLQEQINGEWKLTDKGQQHAEYRPVATGRSSKMQIQWKPSVLTVLKEKAGVAA
jgi:hypothetical protein